MTNNVPLQLDLAAVATNAAGIADAFRLMRMSDHDGDARYLSIADGCGGFLSIAESLAEAAAVMEMFRFKVGERASWGGELPHVYLAWYTIADSLWRYWDGSSIALLTERALLRLIMQHSDSSASETEDAGRFLERRPSLGAAGNTRGC